MKDSGYFYMRFGFLPEFILNKECQFQIIDLDEFYGISEKIKELLKKAITLFKVKVS